MKFVKHYNGTSFFDHKVVAATVELDACLTGFGGRWGNLVYSIPIQRNYNNLAITQLETLNILVAMHLFAPYWHRKTVQIKCDNLAVVQVLTSGKTRDPFLGAFARNVWMVTAQADIDVRYSHIPGCQNNVADLLSRWQGTSAQIKSLHAYIDSPIWVPVSENVLTLDNEI